MLAAAIADRLNAVHHFLRLSSVAIAGLCLVLFIPFWIGMIWDCLFQKRLSALEKAMWLLFIVPFFYVGMLVYYFVVFEKEQAEVLSDSTLLPQ